jgi:membrane protein implicated in regulation of membrane protease activity
MFDTTPRRSACPFRSPSASVAADLVGATGIVRVPLAPIGQVYVDGALWRARADGPLTPGTKVEVEDIDA